MELEAMERRQEEHTDHLQRTPKEHAEYMERMQKQNADVESALDLDWRELERESFVNKDEIPKPKLKPRRGHKDAWRNLFVGAFTKSRPRDVPFLVILVWLSMGVVIFFSFQLVGYTYQQTLSPTLLSGYTERYVGCWFVTLLAVLLSFLRMFLIWFRYRCC